FEGKIRPLLVNNCYKCHSAAEGKSKGSLTVDSREALLKGGENGPAIVPGDPDKSLLIKAVQYHDKDVQMPPKAKLADGEIADLVAWVKMGAPDPRKDGVGKLTGLTDKARAHWAYQPVKPQPVPAVKNAAWAKTPVDNFVLAKLESANLRPNHPAAKEALIRRASYDLIGLPPTPEEVREFVADTSSNAFEKVIDRLLASPHYGERWGRFWLDSARYSDTSGLENLNRGGEYRYAHAWTYRDYVIKAFNDDKPYDQFLREQIAADQLPTAKTDPTTLAALGFLTVGKRFQNVNDQIDERIDALGKATMAMTLGCVRCHDHKFDPLTMGDYYSLHGVFSSITEPAVRPMIAEPADKAAYEDFKAKLESMEQANREAYYSTVERLSGEFHKKASAYLQAAVLGRKNDPEMTRKRNALVAEYKLDRDLYQGLRLQPRRDDEVFLPFFKFAEMPADQIPAKAAEILDAIAEGHLAIAPGEAKVVPSKKPGVDAKRAALLAKGRSAKLNPLVVAAFKDVKPDQIKTLKDVTDVYGKLFASLQARQQEFFKANRTATSQELPGFSEDEIELLNFPMRIRPAAGLDSLAIQAAIAELRLQNGGFQRFNGLSAVNELMLTHPGSPARAMVVNDLPTPKNSYIMIRGEATNRGPVVPRQMVEIIAGKDRKPFTQGSGRLELAQWIGTERNPLTARVAMNRFWMHHFGEGIVRTVDDLGLMCDPPTHPELLDYLSDRFMKEGWSLKRMHKLVMLSATYQQSSDTNLSFANVDPDNRLLWRANLRRLDFEAVRDTLLQYTGKMDHAIGGKPVNLTDEPYSYRRSVYGYIDRAQMPELMQQFDFADADMVNSRRTSTIVPQQALFFMNSPMSVDVARKVVSRPEFGNAKDDAGRVKALYEVLFQRAPKAAEIDLAKQFIETAQANAPEVASAKSLKQGAATAKPKRIEAQIGKGNAKSAIRNSGEMVDRKPLSAWEQYAHALLMTNEIAYVN
ncbi:MAG TPA: PSD1 and planctomycete cytochrome C domain-containing protein, partial [Humisphaera sp.]